MPNLFRFGLFSGGILPMVGEGKKRFPLVTPKTTVAPHFKGPRHFVAGEGFEPTTYGL